MKEKIPTSRKAKKLQRPMSKLKAAGKSRNQDFKKKKKPFKLYTAGTVSV